MKAILTGSSLSMVTSVNALALVSFLFLTKKLV